MSTLSYPDYHCAINNRGIDFLADDGGLSAILGVVTIKLHADSIKALLVTKIDGANISEKEKSQLKEALTTVKDAALTKITEKIIMETPWAALVNIITAIL